MKHPAKEDIDAHWAWITGVVSRLLDAWYRHPYLVLHGLHCLHKSDDYAGGVRLDDAGNYYIPRHATGPLLNRLYKTWQAMYGCTCPVTCKCGRVPKHPALRETAKWIHENPSVTS